MSKKSSKTPHAERAHAVLSASSADRWLNCTPSALMCEKVPNKASSYADEGTLAHEIAETIILFKAGKIDHLTYAETMSFHRTNQHWYEGILSDLEPYVTHVLEQINMPGAIWELEKKTDLTHFIPEGFGTTDSMVLVDRILYITDLKFGRGVRVSAVDNSQLKLYGAGVLIELDTLYDIIAVKLCIVQPRVDNISSWVITPKDLLEWAEQYVRPTAEIASRGEGNHKTGDWCQFCRAKILCPAIKDEALSIALEDFDPEQEKQQATEMDLEAEWHEGLLDIYSKADRIVDYLEAVKSYIYQRAIAGHKWPGLKLVEGKSNRKIVDEENALKFLREVGYEEHEITNVKIKGIGALEDLMNENFNEMMGPYIEKPKGKPTLVDESDRRPEISTADDFI